jgi:hypothetical protein
MSLTVQSKRLNSRPQRETSWERARVEERASGPDDASALSEPPAG